MTAQGAGNGSCQFGKAGAYRHNGETDDKFSNGSKAKRYGIGWQHEVSKAGITLYAAWHQYDQEGGGQNEDTEKFNIVRVGTRVQFK